MTIKKRGCSQYCFTVTVWRTSVTGEPNLVHVGGGLSQGWRLDLRVLWAGCYHIILLLTGVARWGFLLLLLVYCTWGWCLKDAGKKPRWECKRLDWISCCNAWKSCCCCCFCTSQVWAFPIRLLLLVAVSTLLPLRKTNPAISNKFHSMLLLDITAACLASVASNVNTSTASWSYLLLSLFQRRRALNYWVAESLFA